MNVHLLLAVDLWDRAEAVLLAVVAGVAAYFAGSRRTPPPRSRRRGDK